jgi:hypothetical protein
VSPSELAAYKTTYSHMSDYDLAEIHAAGPSGVISPEVWHLVQGEFGRRGTTILEEAGLAVHRQRARSEKQERFNEVHRRSVPCYVRVGTGVLETAILSVPSMAAMALLGADPADGFAGTLLFYLGVYLPVCELLWQRTFAMRALGQHLVRTTGGKPTKAQVLGRWLLRPLGFSGFLWYALWGTFWLHDGLTKTRVVNET